MTSSDKDGLLHVHIQLPYLLLPGAKPGKYFGVGWKYNINTDSIREFYLVKKEITPYTGSIRNIMNLALQNKFYR
jgi:hypothetical protein